MISGETTSALAERDTSIVYIELSFTICRPLREITSEAGFVTKIIGFISCLPGYMCYFAFTGSVCLVVENVAFFVETELLNESLTASSNYFIWSPRFWL
jgi:hypothetical protein